MHLFRLMGGFVVMGVLIWSCGNTTEKEDKKSVAPTTPVESTLRSCELLVKNTETDRIDRVEFSESVDGFYKNRGDYTAIAFVAKSDSPLASDAMRPVMLSGDVKALVVDTDASRCFDSAGAEMPNVSWAL